MSAVLLAALGQYGGGDGYWVRHFMLDNPTGADCIYCRLFPAHKHEH